MSEKSPTFRVSAPGSLMLLGEHAVLHGRRALTLAVDKRIRVALKPRADNMLEIHSTLGRHRTDLQALTPHPAFRFVLEAVRRLADRLPDGLTLRIESEFSHTIGFGSSAAVTAATVAALHEYAGLGRDLSAICKASIAVIRAVQGRGSGADVAASVHGGIVCYRADPLAVEVLPAPYSFCAVYSGYKTPTPEVIRRVEAQWADRPVELQRLYDQMDDCAGAGYAALRAQDPAALGAALNRGQTLMEALGVNTAELAAIVAALRADAGILGAKISGSGLGDCAIGLGELQHPIPAYETIPIRPSATGIRWE